ncbi:hypothetical protein [Treponema pectinovorum]|uniref:hypothetical protein n=1 Tax=Treponema pectinovorum TaxID=164 RepID=UPI0011F252B1|nr:hypothetical protein [Treponema pectinovorum]
MELKEEMKKYFEKGVKTSKRAFTKASEAVSRFSDESVIRLEKHQLQAKLKEEKLELAEQVLKLFENSDKKTISKADETLTPILQNINEIKEKIANLESQLEKK